MRAESGNGQMRSRHVADLKKRLAVGWNTWDTTGVLTHVLLPDGVSVRLGVKEYYRGRTLWDPQIGGADAGDPTIEFEGHSILVGYSSLVVRWAGVELRVRAAGDGESLAVLVEPLQAEVKAAVVVELSFAWGYDGAVGRDGESLYANGSQRSTHVWATSPSVTDPYVAARGPNMVLSLDGPVGFSAGERLSIEEIRARIGVAESRLSAELDARWSVDVDQRLHGEIVRDAIGWNTIFEPARSRVITTVSRAWNVGKRGGFGMFCWDAFFNAALSAIHSRDLAYANALEMLSEVTPEGFVPNVSQGTGRKTFDGSQPPIGALVVWELFTQFGDRWLLEAAFDVLLSWNRWWWRVRRSGPLLSLGSTVFTPEFPSPQDIPRIGQHFGATCESGCDDHPVFSDIPFDEETGLLRAHDVGLNAEYAADCEALALIADELGEEQVAAEARERGAAVREAMDELLWDEGVGTYRSHFSDSGLPTAFLSPLSFYPLFAGLGRGERAARMMDLLDDEQTFGGEWVLPSSPRTEPLASEQSYWRGRAWPPVNFLVYLGLLRSAQDDHAAWLAQRSGALILKEWTEHGHVHENYSSLTGEGCDVRNSEPYYSWGALLSLMVLVEGGGTELFRGWRHRDLS